jgi:hypothetical protein
MMRKISSRVMPWLENDCIAPDAAMHGPEQADTGRHALVHRLSLTGLGRVGPEPAGRKVQL